MGVSSPSGGRWVYCTVAEILKNPTYIGKTRWGHRPDTKSISGGVVSTSRPKISNCIIADGMHEPIIEQELFDKAGSIMSKRSNAPVPKSTQIQNPLAGIVFCKECGRSMERRIFQHGRAALKCPNPECN
jgi:hypothetical protein